MTKLILALGLCLLILGAQASGVPVGLWEDIMRSGAKGDEAFRAAGRAEHVGAELARSGRAEEALGRELGETADAAARTRRLREMLGAAMQQPDPALLRRIGELAPEELEAAVVLARGGRCLIETVPDVARRGRLLRDGGADLVAAAGLHGEGVAREAGRLDALVSAGAVPARVGNMDVVARFSEVMHSDRGGAWIFWQRYVIPYPKQWIAAGALTAYLGNPEYFHDAAGRLTEEGTRRLTKILGNALQGALKGAADGGRDTARGIWREFTDQYVHGDGAWAAWLGLIMVAWVLGALLPRTRRLFLTPVAYFFRKPNA